MGRLDDDRQATRGKDAGGDVTAPHVGRWPQLIAFLVALILVVAAEMARLQNAGGLGDWLAVFDPDTTLYLPLLIAAIPAWFLVRQRRGTARRAAFRDWLSHRPGTAVVRRGEPAAWLASLFVAAVSLAVSSAVADARVGDSERFGNLPPAYHDEYSYLFQAQTFLAGRLTFPTHPTSPEYFDQMHVLNDDGVFAGRYFPGTAVWMAPFVALGKPYWGHWLAGACAAFFVFWAGRELGGNGVGLLAGLLTAVSPGMALFSNLLLAHHPTLVGLTLFLWAFLRLLRTSSRRDALLAGCGLAFGMLCRPMTAAGFAAPFGV
ncbi:MAG: glycosyltransferase family 39 protein, partial [Planctomycetes bacterium]|nr:glycosyltransferase family 39 protein [Planctomycetota bacterium]